MYADEETLYVWETSDPAQAPYVSEPRSSRTLIEYPVVADVDGDGSQRSWWSPTRTRSVVAATAPAVQVYGDMFNPGSPRGASGPEQLSRHQRERRRHDPDDAAAVLGDVQELPHQHAARKWRRVRPVIGPSDEDANDRRRG